MITQTRIAATLAAFCIVVTAEDTTAQRVGYIEKIHGAVFLRTDEGVVKRLSPAHDLARLVDAHDRVRGERGGWIRIQTGSELLKITPGREWTQISHGTKPVPPGVAEALDDYGRTGGRSRSDEARTHAYVIAPVTGSAVAVHRFAIEVIPGAEDCPLALELRDMNRTVLWSIADHRASTSIDPGPLRKILAGLQSDAERVRLEIELIGECTESKIEQFKLLSRGEEDALEQELTDWDKATNDFLLTRLGKASVFAKYDLYLEMVAAYEEALTVAPESISLLARTIEAHDCTGNVRRKSELVRKLNKIEPLEN